MFTHSNERGDKNPNFTCDYCDKSIQPDTGKAGYGQLKINCHICGDGPMYQSKLIPHMIQEHGITESPISRKPVYRCDDCPYVTVKLNLYEEHCRIHVDPNWVKGKKIYNRYPRLKQKKQPKEKSVKFLLCDKCPYSTNRSDLMEQHQLKHSPENIVEHQCDQCDFTSLTKMGMTKHKKIHDVPSSAEATGPRAPFICEICCFGESEDSYTPETFPRHLQEVHQLEEQLFCSLCGKLMESEKDLAAHKSQHDTQYICYVCCVSSETRDEARLHILRHTDDEIQASLASDNARGTMKPLSGTMECEICSYKTDYPPGMRRHKQMHARQTNLHFVCKICNQPHMNINRYNKHLKLAHGVSKFDHQCKQCGHQEASHADLVVHSAEHVKVKEIYSCDVCQYEASRRWNLIRHKETAHKAEIFACDHCDYSTRSIPRIADHFKHVHLVEPPSIIQDELVKEADKGASLAKLHTDKRRAYVKAVKLKKRNNLKKKSEMCDICGKLIPYNLIRAHQNKHTGHKPFRCHYPGCEHETSTGCALAEHIRRRHLNKGDRATMYQCQSCTYTTNSLERLIRHQEKCELPSGGTVPPEYVVLKREDETNEIVTLHMPDGVHEIHPESSADARQEVAEVNKIIDVTSSAAVADLRDDDIEPTDASTTMLIKQVMHNTGQRRSPGHAGSGLVRAASTGNLEMVAAQHEKNIRSLTVADGNIPGEQVTEVYMIIPDSNTDQFS